MPKTLCLLAVRRPRRAGNSKGRRIAVAALMSDLAPKALEPAWRELETRRGRRLTIRATPVLVCIRLHGMTLETGPHRLSWLTIRRRARHPLPRQGRIRLFSGNGRPPLPATVDDRRDEQRLLHRPRQERAAARLFLL